jgi:RNA polymerase sigma-70 factor, ECF subfamily
MPSAALSYEQLSDLELAALVARRDPVAVRLITSRNNQRLFRVAWGVLKDRAEAEEAVQEAYLKGFAAIESFAGKASLSTWLTRIVINEALERRRAAERRSRLLQRESIAVMDDYRERLMGVGETSNSAEADVMRREVAKLLERAIGQLPEALRLVFMLREIEDLSVEETAQALQIPGATVKTRLLRARRRLQNELNPELRETLHGTFPFAGLDCDRLTERVVARFLAG